MTDPVEDAEKGWVQERQEVQWFLKYKYRNKYKLNKKEMMSKFSDFFQMVFFSRNNISSRTPNKRR